MTIYYMGYNPAAFGLLKVLPLLLIAVLIFNMIQKKFIANWGKKRLATFYISIGILSLLAASFVIFRYRISDLWLIPVAGVLLFIAILKRPQILPFVARCSRCKRRLSFFEIFFSPANVCKICRVDEEPETDDNVSE